MDKQDRENELFLIDGSGFIFRAYHALPPLNRPDGTPVNAVLGFTNMLVKLLNDMDVPSIAVIFDAKRANFRNEIYSQYKANRDDPPDDLIPQFALIREATEAFSIPAIELEGFEADDLIATYARLAVEAGRPVAIVSSDKDLMQLVRPGVRMYDPMKYKDIGEAEVLEKFGVHPSKVVDVQALAGDSVDNVPGVPGIGLKTAAQLINEYGDLETLLARAPEIKQPKRRESLIQHAENARISKRLVQLDANVTGIKPLEELTVRNPDKERILSFLHQQGFKNIMARMERQLGPAANQGSPTPVTQIPAALAGGIIASAIEKAGKLPAHYELVQDIDALQRWIDNAHETGYLALDTETTDLTPSKAKLVGISLSTAQGKACYIPLQHRDPKGYSDSFDFAGDAPANDTADLTQIPVETAIAMLKPLLEDPGVMKVGHNIKYDLQMFLQYGVRVAPVDDTMLMSFILDGSNHGHGMDELAELLLGHKTISYDAVTGTGKSRVTFDLVPLDKALHYAAEDADVTLQFEKILKPRLPQEQLSAFYETVERPLIPIIADMEFAGVKVDTNVLRKLSNDFAGKIAELEAGIHKLAGRPFNVGSPKQMGDVLFGEMGLPGATKTKTGAWSTGADVLDELAEHPIVSQILEWRGLSKLKSTYADSLPETINPKTGRVHTSYNMVGANTGRLSSTDPNLQNIPIKTVDGKKIRAAFVPEDGYEFLSVDYSQVELRLAADLANIQQLKDAFHNGIDIHAATASQVFGVPLDQMTPDIRRNAKAINFGIIYGISGFGLAKQLGIPQGEAAAYIKQYLARFPELKSYMDASKEFARTHGYVKTLYGRKVFLRGITDKNAAMRSFAERQAINAPLQGTAADIMKKAMIALVPALQKAKLGARMLLQVHDELLFEVPQGQKQETEALVKKIMEEAGTGLGVPLVVDAGWGFNWADAH
ncbi:MAG TPA: DNA polymerase I [Patescibacteria group bacterium]|nr:DNA polymerase I [Patescibacteria group bacterium]